MVLSQSARLLLPLMSLLVVGCFILPMVDVFGWQSPADGASLCWAYATEPGPPRDLLGSFSMFLLIVLPHVLALTVLVGATGCLRAGSFRLAVAIRVAIGLLILWGLAVFASLPPIAGGKPTFLEFTIPATLVLLILVPWRSVARTALGDVRLFGRLASAGFLVSLLWFGWWVLIAEGRLFGIFIVTPAVLLALAASLLVRPEPDAT